MSSRFRYASPSRLRSPICSFASSWIGADLVVEREGDDALLRVGVVVDGVDAADRDPLVEDGLLGRQRLRVLEPGGELVGRAEEADRVRALEALVEEDERDRGADRQQDADDRSDPGNAMVHLSPPSGPASAASWSTRLVGGSSGQAEAQAAGGGVLVAAGHARAPSPASSPASRGCPHAPSPRPALSPSPSGVSSALPK